MITLQDSFKFLRKMLRLFCFTFCIGLLWCPINVCAQKQSCIWYFGQYAGLDFNSGLPVALTDGVLEIHGGSSSIADANGRLLFYTDGWNVWNRNHERMPGNGDRLNGGGDGSTHSGFIAPRPGSRTQYYIFTTDMPPPFGQYGLQYSIIDMEALGGLGDVVVKNIPMLDSVCTKIAITRHANGRDLWVVTQHMDTNALYSFLITEAGVFVEPVISYIGLSPKTPTMTSRGGQIKFSPDGTKLATAIPSPIDRVEIMEFNRATGKVSNAVISSSFSSSIGAYGIEFSPNNKKLYVSRTKPGILLQYDISDYNSGVTLSSEYVVYQGEYFEALQLAPDGKIYVCHGENEKYVSSIDNPNAKGKDCQYSHQSVYLGGKTTNFCFPSFLTSYFRKPDITHYRTCPGDTTFFTLSATADVDSVEWDFGDPVTGSANTSASMHATHIFSNPGTYTVRLRAYSGWVSDVVEHTVVVAPLPVVDLGPDREVCMGTGVWLYAGEGGLSYEWSTGESTSAVTVRESGEYWVVKRNGICEERDTVHLTFVTPELVLNQDTLLCEGGSVQLRAPEAASYVWEPSEGLDAVDIASPVASPSATTTYTVTISEADGCRRQGRVTVGVLPKDLLSISIPDTLVVSSEKEFFLPVVVQTPASWLPLQLGTIEADIRFASGSFEAVGITEGISTISNQGGETTVHIIVSDVALSQERQVLTSLTGKVLLGEQLTTPIMIENIWANGCEQVRAEIGTLSLDSAEICGLSLRRIRLLTPPEIIITPHPVTSESGIEIRSVERGRHLIVVYTPTGENVWEEVFEGTPDVAYTATLPQTLSSGLYSITLYSPSGTVRRSFIVTR